MKTVLWFSINGLEVNFRLTAAAGGTQINVRAANPEDVANLLAWFESQEATEIPF